MRGTYVAERVKAIMAPCMFISRYYPAPHPACLGPTVAGNNRPNTTTGGDGGELLFRKGQ